MQGAKVANRGVDIRVFYGLSLRSEVGDFRAYVAKDRGGPRHTHIIDTDPFGQQGERTLLRARDDEWSQA